MLLSVAAASWRRLFTIALVYLSSLSNCTLSFTPVPKIVHLGQTYNLRYQASGSDPATILLFRYSTSKVATLVSTLTTTSTGGSYPWTVDKNLLSAAEYWLEIIQDQQQSYSSHFQIVSASAATSVGSTFVTSPSPTSTVTAATVVSSTATLIDTSPSPSSSLQSAASQPSSSGLGSGAKVGIAVGVVFGVLHLVVGAYLLWRRRQNKKRAVVAGEKATESADKAFENKEAENDMVVRELDGKNVLPEWKRRTELHEEPAPMAELPG